ncbi:MAG: hypothetical protein LBB63_01090 [Holosporaceae bacterium]|jgi:hypothetical protein|nr:hypothetical protein [Holosporaceae bacterium]
MKKGILSLAVCALLLGAVDCHGMQNDNRSVIASVATVKSRIKSLFDDTYGKNISDADLIKYETILLETYQLCKPLAVKYARRYGHTVYLEQLYINAVHVYQLLYYGPIGVPRIPPSSIEELESGVSTVARLHGDALTKKLSRRANPLARSDPKEQQSKMFCLHNFCYTIISTCEQLLKALGISSGAAGAEHDSDYVFGRYPEIR